MADNFYARYPVTGGGSGGVTSLNSLTGALTLAAGSDITITPSGGNTLTIASTGGSGANTFLSNLTSPTAINQSLLAGTDSTFNIGAAAGLSRFNNGYFATSLSVGQYPLSSGHTFIAMLSGMNPELQLYDGASNLYGVMTDGTGVSIRNVGTGDRFAQFYDDHFALSDGTTLYLSGNASTITSQASLLSFGASVTDAIISTIDTVTAVNSGNLFILTGNTGDPAAQSGTLTIQTGTMFDVTNTNQSGPIVIQTGDNDGTAGGAIGDITLQTGNGLGSGGSLFLSSANAGGGPSGTIRLDASNGGGGTASSVQVIGTQLSIHGAGAAQAQLTFINNASKTLGLKVPATIATNFVLTLPNTIGSSGQVLGNTGSGVTAWVSAPTGTGTTNYATYWTAASTLGAEQFLSTIRGGTGVDSSGFTGVAKFAAGVFSASTIVNSDISASAAIDNSKLNTMASLTIKGNNTGGASTPIDLTVAQVNAILPVFTSTLNGAAPLSGGGTTNFLRADGTWAAPISAGIVRSINSISSPTTAGATALTDYIYLVSGTTTLTLPTAVGNTDLYTVKNTGVATVTIATTSAQTIDGSGTATLTPNTSLNLISNNSNWSIV